MASAHDAERMGTKPHWEPEDVIGKRLDEHLHPCVRDHIHVECQPAHPRQRPGCQGAQQRRLLLRRFHPPLTFSEPIECGFHQRRAALDVVGLSGLGYVGGVDHPLLRDIDTRADEEHL